MHRGFPDLDAVLRGTLAWPVANIACAVIDRHGDEHHVGNHEQLFALASVTKLATALATLIACEEGVCDLDDPVAPAGGASLRDLLCHAAGLPVDGQGACSPPRTRRIYSNHGYQVLADHVARQAGFAFADYVREAVMEPLGMRTATFGQHAGSSMRCAANDLVRLVRELRTPTLIAPETWRAMITPQYPDLDGILPGYGQQSPNPWGLGPEVRGTKTPHWSSRLNAPETFGHFGRTGTLVWIDPVANVAFLALTDREFGAWATEAWPHVSSDLLDHA